MNPIKIDSKGSGLYQVGPGVRAFIDYENPEDRMIRHLIEDCEREREAEECMLDQERLFEEQMAQLGEQDERESPDWHQHEQPCGSMEEVTYGDADRYR